MSKPTNKVPGASVEDPLGPGLVSHSVTPRSQRAYELMDGLWDADELQLIVLKAAIDLRLEFLRKGRQ